VWDICQDMHSSDLNCSVLQHDQPRVQRHRQRHHTYHAGAAYDHTQTCDRVWSNKANTYSFNKTKAAVCPMHTLLPKDFPFLRLLNFITRIYPFLHSNRLKLLIKELPYFNIKSLKFLNRVYKINWAILVKSNSVNSPYMPSF